MHLIELLSQNPQTKRIVDAMGGARPPVAVFGVFGITATVLCGAIAKAAGQPILIITETDAEAATAASDLSIMGLRAVHYCSRDLVFYDIESASRDSEQQRLFALGRIANRLADAVCASVEAASQPCIPKSVLLERSIHIKSGDTANRDELLRALVAAGYSSADIVEGAGQFSARGGLIDIFPAAAKNPVRIDLFGDSVEELYSFDPLTQRRVRKQQELYISPSREVFVTAESVREAMRGEPPQKLLEICRRDLELIEDGAAIAAADRYMPFAAGERATLLDYLPDTITVICESSAVLERRKNLAQRYADDMLALSAEGLIDKRISSFFSSFPEIKDRPLAVTESFSRAVGYERLSDIVQISASALPRWAGDLKQLSEDVREYSAQGMSVAVLAGTPRAAEASARDLADEGYAAGVHKELSVGGITVCPFTLSGGFRFADEKICVIASRREPQLARRRKTAAKEGRGIGSLEELSSGDLVVHINHGIGRFDGIKTVNFHGNIKDYISIAYRGGDMLFVPVNQLDMVTLYTAPSDKAPAQLAKLNSNEWSKTKESVYRSARDMARELIELYSKRSREEGVTFSEDGEWQRDFETRFQYDETDDQLRSIDEIKRDMQRPAPMDRLLCGDVGVGKTEVAMRAAFKAVNDGYQVAVLVPTTILAWQHYHTFLQRFESFPVEIAMLSRFSTASQMKRSLKGAANGTVDIAIGTHRLLQSDVKFKKLGLLIIDEEQRFGVGHKEKLKQAFLGVDVLTLSATPIPRTLDMALSGIRDMSAIDEPPHGRQPVQTYVIEHDAARIADAIRTELSRGGQIYYIHNRIDSIDACAERLRQTAPDARIETAHGRMDEAQLSRVWQRLIDGECDILVCTTIIETGVDVPNVNTLIVEDADNMGLAQLYQLRGRVGRSSRRAYAYFTFKRDSVLTEIAAKRLSAIKDFTGFGSGFRIAMRDLQIRGAGSVLTARQSGHMNAVGYDMYLKILKDAVMDERGEQKHRQTDCTVDLALDAHIPTEYIESTKNRIDIYKKIAAVDSEETAADVIDELIDRFGPLPAAVSDLTMVSQLRTAAGALGFYEIKQQGGRVIFYTDNLDLPSINGLLKKRLRPVAVATRGKTYIAIDLEEGESVLTASLALLGALLEAVNELRCLQSENNVV